ncbi:MAG: helix-turn-helix domain-containing protein, partial [Betaproteobacteria bacterium]
ALRAKRITYAEVARRLDLSEASVKRLLSRGGLTLERFEQICQVAGIRMVELVRETDRGKDMVSQLELSQERVIMADVRLLLVAVCALNHLSADDMVAVYDLTKAEVIKLLLKLEKIDFLELLPENRIRLKVSRTFSWHPNGPIQQYFKARAQNEFFRAHFDGDNEIMLLSNATLTPATQAQLVQRLKRVANEFTELHEESKHMPLGERRSTTLLLAIRPWELDEFRALRRKPPQPNARAASAAAPKTALR